MAITNLEYKYHARYPECKYGNSNESTLQSRGSTPTHIKATESPTRRKISPAARPLLSDIECFEMYRAIAKVRVPIPWAPKVRNSLI